MLKFSTRTIQGKRKKQKQKQKKPTFSRLLWLKRNDQSKVIGRLYFEKDKAIRLEVCPTILDNIVKSAPI